MLRNEVDLHQLRDHLLMVVQDTMQPSHVSLWLRNPESCKEHITRLLPRIERQALDTRGCLFFETSCDFNSSNS